VGPRHLGRGVVNAARAAGVLPGVQAPAAHRGAPRAVLRRGLLHRHVRVQRPPGRGALPQPAHVRAGRLLDAEVAGRRRHVERRRVLVAGAGVVVAWLVLGAVLPHGVPLGVVFLGLVLGALTALTALGLVLIYRSSRIINFAQAEIGGFAASIAIVLVTGVHV